MPMSLFDALRSTHREIEGLFGDVQNAIATEQHELAEMLFQLASVKIVSAMRAEHSVVYPRFAREAGLVDEVSQALREHDGIERMIDMLRVGGLEPTEWCVAVQQLGTLVADHADCEECTLFPIASLSFSSQQLAEMGRDYQERMAQIAPIAGASITYELALPEQPPVLVIRFKAA
ncbi:MAG: hemerythrin domain-containing protein [Deltaproteobacteria bacterium]|nr:hemerythrin domain-containing protein [Deltaproteobacteria bacterium]